MSSALEVQISLSIDEEDGFHAEDHPSKNNKVFESTVSSIGDCGESQESIRKGR